MYADAACTFSYGVEAVEVIILYFQKGSEQKDFQCFVFYRVIKCGKSNSSET